MICQRCHEELLVHGYQLQQGRSILTRCLRCAMLYRPMVLRSLLIAAFVGTILTAINQGNLIVQGQWSWQLVWKVPLTYLVPYCVSTAGALFNGRTRSAAQEADPL